jgi:hypothetical protein
MPDGSLLPIRFQNATAEAETVLKKVLFGGRRDVGVIQELESLLGRALTPEEIRLLLLANVIEEDILERETASRLAA